MAWCYGSILGTAYNFVVLLIFQKKKKAFRSCMTLPDQLNKWENYCCDS